VAEAAAAAWHTPFKVHTFGRTITIPSMGLVYLHTVHDWWFFNGKCRQIYQSHGWYNNR